MRTDTKAWQKHNLETIRKRLAQHLDRGELAKIVPSDIQGVFVRTVEDVLELYCFDAETRTLSDIMSRIDLRDPLNLVAIYSQVMFLTQVWHQRSPETVYIAGFGGGRLGMLYHHFNPQALIHGSDFDPAILEVASEYFGVEYDERYAITAADSAEDIDSRDALYDIIIIDVFSDSGTHASHLASQEFFETCKSRLTENGVVGLNLTERDPGRIAKANTMKASFPYTIEWHDSGSQLLFGSKTPCDLTQLVSRARKFEAENGISFPFAEHVQKMRNLSAIAAE